MKCLRKYKWVKLPRKEMPGLKGRLGYWLKLAESAAFRKGIGTYCGHKNLVDPGAMLPKLQRCLPFHEMSLVYGLHRRKKYGSQITKKCRKRLKKDRNFERFYVCCTDV